MPIIQQGLRGAEVIGKEWKQKQARPWGETEDGGIKTRAGKTGMDGDKEKGEGGISGRRKSRAAMVV